MLSSFAISISNNQFLDISTQEDPEKKTLSKNEIDRLLTYLFFAEAFYLHCFVFLKD